MCIDAARIAAADVQTERHPGKSIDDGVIGTDRAIEILRRVLATRPHPVERHLVDIGGEARRVDVHIAAAGIYQISDHLALDRDHVRDRGVEALGLSLSAGFPKDWDSIGLGHQVKDDERPSNTSATSASIASSSTSTQRCGMCLAMKTIRLLRSSDGQRSSQAGV